MRSSIVSILINLGMLILLPAFAVAMPFIWIYLRIIDRIPACPRCKHREFQVTRREEIASLPRDAFLNRLRMQLRISDPVYTFYACKICRWEGKRKFAGPWEPM
jgi:hypothetical protein